MHVCHLVNSLSVGGAEQSIHNLVAADDETNYTVCALEADAELGPKIRKAGADVYLAREQFRFDPRAISRLRRELNRKRIDVLHTHLPYAQIVGRLAAPGTGIQAIVSTQHSLQQLYHPVMRTLEQATASCDDASVAVSNGVRASFGDSRPSRTWRTIYNGIDATAFHRDVKNHSDPNSTDSRTTFLNVARCVPAKGQSVLIEAMDDVVSELPDARLQIAGGGPLLEDLQNQVTERGLDEHIDLVGHVTSIEAYYAKADVFVLPSRIEGLPVTVLEAMAAELPVVASNIPGVSEVVADGETGRLVSQGDASELADAMVDIAKTSPQQTGQSGFKRIKKNFSISQMLESYLKLYDEALE